VPALKICQLGKDLLQETPDDLPMEELTMPLRLVCVGFGGLLGSWIGALHLNPRTLRFAASSPLAYGGRENDYCFFLRKHAVADEQPRRLRLTAARFELEAVLLAPPLR
jgi:hypothetical protein